jgi:Transposase DDE domain
VQGRAAAPQKKGFQRLQRHLFHGAHARGLIADKPEAAVDATGLESRYTSQYFVLRQGKRHRSRRYTKLTVACHTQSHLLAAAVVSTGPSNDSPQFAETVRGARRHAAWDRVLADAAFDAEHHHRLCREELGIRSTVIPLNRRGRGRQWPQTRYRRQMRRRFHRRKYGQRWQVESAFSRHKRLLGAALRGRSDAARERECYLRVLTHNLMLLAAA